MTTECMHERYTTIATRPFFGPVSSDENRAAHGCICDEQECAGCGARRSVNLNGGHAEFGSWGDSRAQRDQIARELEQVARALVAAAAPVDAWCSDGRALRLSVDNEGMICAHGSPHTEAEVASAAAANMAFAGAAVAARKAVLAAQAAREDV